MSTVRKGVRRGSASLKTRGGGGRAVDPYIGLYLWASKVDDKRLDRKILTRSFVVNNVQITLWLNHQVQEKLLPLLYQESEVEMLIFHELLD